jgi:fluoride exporter
VTVVLVVLGAMVGAPARYLIDRAVMRDSVFPWGTLTVNVIGSFLLGYLAASAAASNLFPFLGTGLCGALTTYSTFGYETVRLLQDGARRHALSNVVVSIVAGLAAAYAGLAVSFA